MDDFLHNLRTGNQKGYDRGRKPYEGNRFNPGDRSYHQNNRRKHISKKQYPDDWKKAIDSMNETNTRMVNISEKRIKVETRIAVALETIAGQLGDLISGGITKPASSPPSLSKGNYSGKPEIISAIKKLHEDGLSYEKIARHMAENGIPTISGRGKWRGQMIYRLLKEDKYRTA